MTVALYTVVRGIVGAFLLATTACRSGQSDSSTRFDDRRTYGFAVGDSIAAFSVDCLKAGPRALGLAGATQVITFSTPGDCSTCMPHLAGLDSLAIAGRGPRDNVIVTFSPGQTPASVARLYGGRMARDVCVDTAGFAWDALNIGKTPITVLLVSGRVSFMTNKGLLSDSSRTRFLSEIERHARDAMVR